MYFWKKGIYHNRKFKDHFVVCDVALHNGSFWEILSKKYLKHILISGTNKKIWKSKNFDILIFNSAFDFSDFLLIS